MTPITPERVTPDPATRTPEPLSTHALKLAYGQNVIIPGLDLTVAGGQVTSIIGPNGCGKSTLLRALARLLPSGAGHIELYGQALHALPSREIARRLAILPQGPAAPEGLSVEDLVWFGRHPHQGRFPVRRAEDREAVQWALDQTGMRVFAARPLEALSGGQRQRAWIAMSLAQQTDILLLDEPTTYLDPSHQLEVLHLAQRLNREQGKTVVMVLHDLNQAVRYSDRLIAMSGGAVYAHGPAEDVLTHDLLRDVFGLKAHLLPDPDTGRPHVIPYALTR
ncbi:ABC transporter ATP-binding protein [Deinococcus soli (ex Cha et al. 2016)]|uniref:Iron complex transport system ATP-binding protein n=2 Tax=Deinococcus soli (ex Cha et al. 2016) TaxID=1309411 RepID=A0AAE4BLY0_9DEIO|nr:ABC transporter ATP-binding protein [Deinococcus soli (ex Cha et al. 2016)]MDR6217912.1 iron complex transport system ATP-binding protein [Deinococcus soli (ex Cha et al. 2016)]MDR6328162.1 iron complex transport system ATP-binding protein [Deinococcus soli (ex Cha et al. 2016)]MDR6751014.1 iron complex transport system ATP-binding protein [Deinococcus soli (ex Cha et al. 2016)]